MTPQVYKPIFFLLGLILLKTGFGQAIVPVEVFSNQSVNDLVNTYSNTDLKQLPKEYEKEVQAALAYFPELKNVPIKFKVKKSYATLKTRPSFLSMFMPKGHRRYIIVISDKTITDLAPITFQHLPEDARIGIIGHELSHVVDFSGKSTWQGFTTAVGHLSASYMDSLEYHTDQICIEHGLGKELESWSSYVRNAMHTKYWRGADYVKKGDEHIERYMNPDTIEKYLTLQHVVAHKVTINTD